MHLSHSSIVFLCSVTCYGRRTAIQIIGSNHSSRILQLSMKTTLGRKYDVDDDVVDFEV